MSSGVENTDANPPGGGIPEEHPSISGVEGVVPPIISESSLPAEQVGLEPGGLGAGIESPQLESVESSHERGGIVTARGTGDGLVLRLDGRVDRDNLKTAINDFMVSRRGFLGGQSLSLEWVGALPDDGFVKDVSQFLESNFEVIVKTSRPLERERFARAGRQDASDDRLHNLDPDGQIPADNSGSLQARIIRTTETSTAPTIAARLERTPSLFDGVEALGRDLHSAASRSLAGKGSAIWDEPDARIVYSTLRSGQKIESEHSVVVFGDVNSGAEVIAGGDIIVLGTLRGIAHAGAYDETGGGRVIFALSLQPTQLRIGSLISRGEAGSAHDAEVARVEGTIIVVESYQPRGVSRRRSR